MTRAEELLLEYAGWATHPDHCGINMPSRECSCGLAELEAKLGALPVPFVYAAIDSFLESAQPPRRVQRR